MSSFHPNIDKSIEDRFEDEPKYYPPKPYTPSKPYPRLWLPRIQVSNLPLTTMSKDLEELFNEFGVEKAHIDYDKKGNATGNAEIWFFQQDDAIAAMRKFQNTTFNGQKILIKQSTKITCPFKAGPKPEDIKDQFTDADRIKHYLLTRHMYLGPPTKYPRRIEDIYRDMMKDKRKKPRSYR